MVVAQKELSDLGDPAKALQNDVDIVVVFDVVEAETTREEGDAFERSGEFGPSPHLYDILE